MCVGRQDFDAARQEVSAALESEFIGGSSPDSTGYSEPSPEVAAEVVVTEREDGGYEVVFREDDGTTAVLVVTGPDATNFAQQLVRGYVNSYDKVIASVGRG